MFLVDMWLNVAKVGLELHRQAKHSAVPEQIPSAHPAEDETSLTRFSAQVDDLRLQVKHLTSEKDALQRLVSTEFPEFVHLLISRIYLQVMYFNSSVAPTSHREAALLQENERLRRALLAAQSNQYDVSAVRDPFLSPSPNSAEINSCFPPLEPDLSSFVTPTSFTTTYHFDDLNETTGNDDPTGVPLPPSPPSRQSRAAPGEALSGPLWRSHVSPAGSSTGLSRSSSTAVAALQAEIAADLAAARLDTERREQEMEELRMAIGTLTTDATTDAPS